MKKITYYIVGIIYLLSSCHCNHQEYLDYGIKCIEIKYIDFSTVFCTSHDCSNFDDSSNFIMTANVTVILNNNLTDSKEVLRKWRLKLNEEKVLDTIRTESVDSVFLQTHTKTTIIDKDTIKYVSYVLRLPNSFSKIIITDSTEILEFSKQLFDTQKDTIPEINFDARAKILLYYENGEIDEICLGHGNVFQINSFFIQIKNYGFYNYLTKLIKNKDKNFEY